MSTCAKQTTCPYCGVGCGVDAQIEDDQIIAVSGSESHPANNGLLCVKGSALHETTSMEGRLLSPLVDGEKTSWETAISRVSEGFKQCIAEHGPDSVAFYLSGQLLTEDYYVANKLMKGFVGSANVDTNSRLCMASAVVGYKRAFGSDTVPGNYEDLELCDLLVMTGSNAAWTHPVIYQRIVAAKNKNPAMKVVVIDPKLTATADVADLVLRIQPGTDAELFSALLSYLHSNQKIDSQYIAEHTKGFADALEANQLSLAEASEITGIDAQSLEQFFNWFAETEKTVTLYSQGVNQSSNGTDKCNAIINCHLATGRIGKAGMGPFSITGQPNAMGGREVGGLANQLAAHMDFSEESCDRLSRFWSTKNVASSPGLKAVDLFDAVESGKVKAIWIMATNPVVSMPEADRVRSALAKCPLVVVSDCMSNTDTTAVADILLPATTWAEKDGTVTNSERCISRQKGLLPKPGEALHDWEIICAVAKEMGYAEAFGFDSPRQIFAEHAALSAFENNGHRDFDISYFADISDEEYQNFTPRKWPVTAEKPQGTDRMFAQGEFFTPDKKARFVVLNQEQRTAKPKENHDFLLNTGRVRDQWHTMTRTAKSPRLLRHVDLPFVEIHPEDAFAKGISEKDLVEIHNELGLIRLPAKLSRDCARGQLFAPIHWNEQYASPARVDLLVPSLVDPFSGQPESKNVSVSIRKATTMVWLRLITTNLGFAKKLLQNPVSFWARNNLTDNRYRFDLALASSEQLQSIQNQLGSAELKFETSELSTYLFRKDEHNQSFIQICSSFAQLGDSSFAENCIGQKASPEDWLLLSGQGQTDSRGAVICSCYEVCENEIQSAITAGCASAAALGEKLKCGTNCGSCIPELNSLISNSANAVSDSTASAA